MTIYLGVAAVVAIVGLVLYMLCTNVKYIEVGRIMFAAGLFGLLLQSPVLFK